MADPHDQDSAQQGARKLDAGIDLEPVSSPDSRPGPAVSAAEKDAEAARTARLGLGEKLIDGERVIAKRFALLGEIARGGMGAILKVRDRQLRRTLAMKVVLPDRATEGSGTPRVPESKYMRFLEEAQITGQLDHPGIVPVHELGVEGTDRVWFTMPLIRGREFKDVLEHARTNQDGWSVTRGLSVILRVCETMAYAHSKGVVHRDLKPANIMVGQFGETYVMDWGLARVLGRKETRDVRLRVDDLVSRSLVKTDRRENADVDPDSSLITMDGDVVGTPAYMAPEQAQGKLEEIGPRSDIYALGAILYHLLAGVHPYQLEGTKQSPHTILAKVLEGPPAPIAGLAQQHPAELVAICEKAMRRRADERYASMLDMAEDLRAFLEGRVVKAYESGALAEFRKWVRRNRMAAALIAAVILTTIGGLAGIAYLQVQERRGEEIARREIERQRDEANSEKQLKETALVEAERMRTEAEGQRDLAQQRGEETRRKGYVSNVRAAHAALRLDEAEEALRLLADCPEDLRGWEWSHLALRASPELNAISVDRTMVLATKLWLDGTHVATVSASGLVSVMERSSGAQSAHWRAGEVLVASAAAFNATGDRVAIAYNRVSRNTESLPLRLCDSFDGGRVVEVQLANVNVVSLAYDQSGARLAVGLEDGSALLVDTQNGAVLQRLEALPVAVECLGFDLSGTLLAVGGAVAEVSLWSVESGQRLARLDGHGRGVASLAFTPVPDSDEQRLVCATGEGPLRVWRGQAQAAAAFRAERMLVGHTAKVTLLCSDPSGKRLASVGDDHTLRLWTLEDGRYASVVPTSGTGWTALSFDAEGGTLAVGTRGGQVRLIDPLACSSGSRPPPGQLEIDADEALTACAFAPSGALLATGFSDGSLILWEASTLLPTARLEGHQEHVECLDFSPDGRLLASGSGDDTVRLWNAQTGELEGQLVGHGDAVTDVEFSPDGTQILTACGDKSARLWEVSSRSLLRTFSGHSRRMIGAVFCAGGTRIVTASVDRSLRVWDSATGECLRTLSGHETALKSLCAHPSLARVASGDSDGVIKLWDIESGACLASSNAHTTIVTGLAFFPDGSRLVSSAAANVVLSNAQQLEPLLSIRKDETNRASQELDALGFGTLRGLQCLALSPDGRRIALGATGGPLVLESESNSRRASELRARLGPREAAVALVEDLFRRQLFADEVRAQLRRDTSLPAALRVETLRVVDLFADSETRLVRNTWKALSARPAERPASDLIQRAVSKLCDRKQVPREYRVLRALSLLRTGQAEQALEELPKPETFAGVLVPAEPAEEASQLAVRALCLQALERHEEARACLEALRPLCLVPEVRVQGGPGGALPALFLELSGHYPDWSPNPG